jgi:hypothetical protein
MVVIVRKYSNHQPFDTWNRLSFWVESEQQKCHHLIKLKNCYYWICRKINGRYPDYLPSFAYETISACGENLGREEPENYPAQYWCDDKFPVKDVETKITHIE